MWTSGAQASASSRIAIATNICPASSRSQIVSDVPQRPQNVLSTAGLDSKRLSVPPVMETASLSTPAQAIMGAPLARLQVSQ